jgi:hypothetical protein
MKAVAKPPVRPTKLRRAAAADAPPVANTVAIFLLAGGVGAAFGASFTPWPLQYAAFGNAAIACSLTIVAISAVAAAVRGEPVRFYELPA